MSGKCVTIITSYCCKAPVEPSVIYLLHHCIFTTMPEPQLIQNTRKVVGLHRLLTPQILQVECFILDSVDPYNGVVRDSHTGHIDTWLQGVKKHVSHFLVLVTIRRQWYCLAFFISPHGVPSGGDVTCMCA